MIYAGCGVDISYFDQGKICSDTFFLKKNKKKLYDEMFLELIHTK